MSEIDELKDKLAAAEAEIGRLLFGANLSTVAVRKLYWRAEAAEARVKELENTLDARDEFQFAEGLKDGRAEAVARIDALTAALRKYGRHDKGCRYDIARYTVDEKGQTTDVGNPCICGLSAALNAALAGGE